MAGDAGDQSNYVCRREADNCVYLYYGCAT